MSGSASGRPDEIGLVSPVLAEIAGSSLDVAELPGNPAKIRLILDLVAELSAKDRLRVLDVGCGGKFNPFNVFAPLRSWASRLEIVGTDVGYLDATTARARELGFHFTPIEASVHDLLDVCAPSSFDAVVSTQVLEHLPRWSDALRVMRDLLEVGGLLLVTCDSGDRHRPTVERLRLAGKCAYSLAAQRLPSLRRALRPFASGEWERAPKLSAVRAEVLRLGLQIERLEHFGLRDLKTVQRAAGAQGRMLWLAYEEALAHDEAYAGLCSLLYLRARRTA